MGIDVTFEGRFNLNHPLLPEQAAYLKEFSRTRRVKWSVSLLSDRADPVREAVGLPLGPEGSFFVGGESRPIWQGGDPAVLDHNQPPTGQPGLWCHWVPTEDGTAIVSNGDDRFYAHADWLTYLIEQFLQPWGYILNGSVSGESEELYEWSEADQAERPCIVQSETTVRDNVVVYTFKTIWLSEDETDAAAGNSPASGQPFNPDKWDNLWTNLQEDSNTPQNS